MSIADHVRDSPDARRDHSAPRSHCLNHGDGRALAERAHDQDVDVSIDVCEISAPSQKEDPVCNARLMGLSLQARALRSVPDDDGIDRTANRSDHLGDGLKEVVSGFDGYEPSDESEDHRFGGNAERLPERPGMPRCFEERRENEAQGNDGHAARVDDPPGQEFLTYSITDSDRMVDQPTPEAALKRGKYCGAGGSEVLLEQRPVVGLNNVRNAGRTGRDCTE